ncbi:MAG: T9SS C-terminal target domain-containing protein [Bacteroidetes bacterium]|nr:MAG: T9SS C-terminal target domain-containing protein [Bacteroidota bacterium]
MFPGVMDCSVTPAEQITNDAFDCVSLLPLDLLTFQATSKEDAIQLNWTSANEIDFAGYELQRSTNGRDFGKIAWVDGLGGEQNAYAYADKEVQRGRTYYYRLQMVDLDGSTSYSDIRTALLPAAKGGTTLVVQPNPAKGKFYASFELGSAVATTFELFAADGRRVYQQHYNLLEGPNQLMINTSPYPAGLYTAVVRSAGQEWTAQVVIE